MKILIHVSDFHARNLLSINVHNRIHFDSLLANSPLVICTYLFELPLSCTVIISLIYMNSLAVYRQLSISHLLCFISSFHLSVCSLQQSSKMWWHTWLKSRGSGSNPAPFHRPRPNAEGSEVGCIDGHNRRWIDGSIPILSIDTIGHADHR